MKITNIDGTSFSFSILGYQFPYLTTGYDANWLVVKMIITTPPVTWTSIVPTITTEEFDEMIEWFQLLMDDEYHSDDYYFTEPKLRFETYSETDQGKMLRVIIRKGRRCRDYINHYVLDFPISEIPMYDVIADLRKYQERFPTRYVKDDSYYAFV